MTAAPSHAPRLTDARLPLHSTLFPGGHEVRIATNNEAVIGAAESMWGRYTRLFSGAWAELRVEVSETDAPLGFQQPQLTGDGNLVALCHTSYNYANADLGAGSAWVRLSRNAARDTAFTCNTFIEPMVYLMVSARRFAMLHASCVARNGRAVILCGDAGAGKTCLAYACARAGWTFLSGDATQAIRSSPSHRIVGRPGSIRFRESAARLFPELAGLPVSRRLPGKLDIECDPRSLGLATAQTSEASHIVFLNRRKDTGRAFFEPVSFVEAFSELEKTVFYGSVEIRAEQRRTLARLLALPVLRLTYSNLADAEQLLRREVDAENGVAA